MIDRQLLRIPFYGTTTIREMAEAFSFCYAACQSGGPIPARMTESFKRAWDFDDWEFHATVLAGRPGYVIAYFYEGYRGKNVVAIRGMTNWASLLPIRGGFAASRYAATPTRLMTGYVFGLFQSYADTLCAELEANTQFMTSSGPTDNEPKPLLLTGFSLGAAVAEVLAAKLRAKYPRWPIKLVKFASPKVGSAAWQDNPEVAMPKLSVYRQGDPIQSWPFNTIRSPSLSSPNVFAPFEPDPLKTIVSHSGEQVENSPEDFLDFIRSTAQIPLMAPPITNRWWNHRWESYRYALCRMCLYYGDNWADARLRFLEFPFDNIWGRDFGVMADWAPLIGVANPPPPDHNPGFTAGEVREVETIREREAVATVERDTTGTSEGAGWGGAADLSESGGAWGGGGDYVAQGDSEGGAWGPPVNPALMGVLPPIVQVQRRTRARRPIQELPWD